MQKHTCYGKSHRRCKSIASSTSVEAPFSTQNKIFSDDTLDKRLPDLTHNIPTATQFFRDQNVSIDLNVVLQSMMSYFAHPDVPMTSRVDFIKSLLKSSRIISSNQQSLLGSVTRFLHLQVENTYRQSVVMRLNGNIKGSKQAIKLFASSLDLGSDSLLQREDLAILYLSQAMNHICNFRFDKAHKEIAGLPGKQEHLLWNHIFCVGRIMRGEGHFEESRMCFQICSRTPGLSKYKLYLLQSYLADLYCELAYLSGRPAYLSEAEEMVESQIEQLRLSSSQHLRGFRRLLLSFVEIKIRKGCNKDADLLVRELLAMYGNLRQLDMVDRLGHVRALIAFARLSPGLEEARKRWEDILIWNRFYNPSEEEVFTCAVVYHYLCDIWYKLGDIDKGMESFQNAMQVLRRKQIQFLIPGIGTYLFHDARERISLWHSSQNIQW